MWTIYTVGYYSAGQNNDITKSAGKWLELEKINLSEVTQTLQHKQAVLTHKWVLAVKETRAITSRPREAK